MFSAQAVGNNDQKLNIPNKEFRENIQSIQKKFERPWNVEKYPFECKLNQVCYIKSENGAIGSGETQIQSLFEKLKNYQNADEIQTDFQNLRMFWKDVCFRNKVNDNFRDSYLIILRIMEAFFIAEYMMQLSHQFKTIPKEEHALDGETKIDFQSVSKEILGHCKTSISGIFAKQSEEFGKKILEEVTQLNVKVGQYNNKVKAIVEAEPDRFKKRSLSTKKDVRQLAADELAYFDLLVSSHALPQLKADLQTKKNNDIDNFSITLRSEPVSLNMDYKTLQALHPYMEELKKIQGFIDVIKEQNALRELESAAAFRLQDAISSNVESELTLIKDILQLSVKPGFFQKDEKAIHQMVEACLTLIDELNRLPQMIRSKQSPSPALMDDAYWVEQKAALEEKLKNIQQQIEAFIKNDIKTDVSFNQYREQIIARERAVLNALTNNIKEITPIPPAYLELRRKELDAQWEVLLSHDETHLDELRNIHKKLRKGAEKSSNDAMTREIYKQTAALIHKKIKDHSLPLSEVADQDEKKTSPPLPPLRPYPYKKDEIVVKSNPSSKQPWHANLYNKPWKRALWVGLCIGVGIGLIATGVGIAFELSLTYLLIISLGGGGFFGALLGRITYACSSHQSNPPAPVELKATMRKVNTPSGAKNSLYDHSHYGTLFSPSNEEETKKEKSYARKKTTCYHRRTKS